MGASRWQRFRLVRLPQAMPSFFTALRIGITYAVTGAIFAEYVGATAGLGIYMSLQKNSFRTDLVLAAVVVTAVLSVTLFALTYRRPAAGDPVAPARLTVDGLRKAYGELPVLDGVVVHGRRAASSSPSSGPAAAGRARCSTSSPGSSRRTAAGCSSTAPTSPAGPTPSPTCRSRTCCSRGGRCSTTPPSASRWRGCGAAPRASGPGRCSPSSGSPGSRARGRGSCRAGCASAPRCCAPSSRSGRCCCSTSRSAPWTR